MRWRSTQAQAGTWISSSYPGIGVPAAQIPSTGTSGPAFLFADIAANGFAASDELRLELLTRPAAGKLLLNQDSSGSFTEAPAGTYPVQYRGIRNGQPYGDFTISLIIGDEPPPTKVGTISVTAAAAVALSGGKVAAAVVAMQASTALSLAHIKQAVSSLSVPAAATITVFGANTAAAQRADQVADIRSSNAPSRYVTKLSGGAMTELIQFWQASSAAIHISYSYDNQALSGLSAARYQLYNRDGTPVLTLDLGAGVEFVDGKVIVFISDEQTLLLDGLYTHECAIRDLTGRQHIVLAGPIKFLATKVRI